MQHVRLYIVFWHMWHYAFLAPISRRKKVSLCDFTSYSDVRDATHFTSYIQAHIDIHAKSIHYKIKDMKCQFCDYSTSAIYNLKQHTLVNHLDKTGMKKYPCSGCSYETISKRDLQRHEKNTNKKGAQDEYKCTMCEKGFNLRGNRATHVKAVHYKTR